MPTPPPSDCSPGSDRPPNKRQQQAAATQDQLLAAARSVFEEKGYQGATVGAITDRANTAHGTFYLYFRNKEDAFNRVIAGLFDEMLAASETRFVGGGPRVAIEDVVARYLTIYTHNAGLFRTLFEAVMANPSISESWVAMRRRWVERMARGLNGLQRTGRMRTVDTELAAYVLAGMTEWFAFTHLVLGEPPPGDDPVPRASAVVADLFVHAVFGRLEDDPQG
ncbi:MAG TPA: TetR/AcrR family transcriptional regulator [Acidimicrobiales bacterium]